MLQRSEVAICSALVAREGSDSFQLHCFDHLVQLVRDGLLGQDGFVGTQGLHDVGKVHVRRRGDDHCIHVSERLTQLCGPAAPLFAMRWASSRRCPPPRTTAPCAAAAQWTAGGSGQRGRPRPTSATRVFSAEVILSSRLETKGAEVKGHTGTRARKAQNSSRSNGHVMQGFRESARSEKQ